jgi:hypothetical protein
VPKTDTNSCQAKENETELFGHLPEVFMIGAGDNDQVTMTYGFWGATNNHCDMSPECYILHLGT